MTTTLTTSRRNKTRKHKWFQRTVRPVFDDKTGNERHERVCEFCQMTRTTVIPPTHSHRDVWIEWVDTAGKKTIGGRTPECVGEIVVSVR